jgi:Protein of unknown function (DUF1360)
VTPPRIDVLADPVTLAVGALAVYRATRLLVEDEVAAPLRDRVEQANPQGRAAYLVRCPWCVSIHVGIAWAGLTLTAPRVARVAGAALAWSAASGLLSSWE